MHEDEQILAKQKIEGLSGSLKDESFVLLPNQKNTRFIGIPFTHLAHTYKLGENGVSFGPKIERKKMRLEDKKEIFGKKIEEATSQEEKERIQEKRDRYVSKKEAKIENKKDAPVWTIIPGFDKQKVQAKEKKIAVKFDRKIAETSKEKKQNKLRAKKARKLDKKRRKINQGNQIMRWGEPLAIYDHNKARLGAQDIQNFLYSKGYFEAEVSIDTASLDSLGNWKRFGKKLRNSFSRIAGAKYRYIDLTFYVDKKHRYFIDSIEYDIKDPVLKELVFEHLDDAPLQKSFYDQKTITEERNHIYDLAMNNGYYEFKKQYISFKVDSVQLGQDTLIVREIIENPEEKDSHKIFYLDSIIFISEASINQSFKRSVSTYQDVTFSFARKKYPERILGWRIPIEQDDRYSREQTLETQRQLSFLDNFKFVNINYDTTGNTFVANIFTSPFDKFQTSSEFGLSSTQGNSQGNPGPFVNINLKNRNTFNLLEIISLDFNAKLQDLSQVQNDIENDFTGAYTSRQIGGELSVVFPQFLFPIGNKYQNRIGKYNPNTRVSFGVTYEDRVNEYKRLEYKGAIAYRWQVKNRINYSITPAKIRWIDAQNTAAFEVYIDSLIERRNSFANAFRSAVANSSSFERNQNFGNYREGGDGAFLRTFFEIGGQFNGLLESSFFGDELEKFSYVKVNIDARRIHRLSSKYNIAYRLNVGYAYPFGENRGLPYDGYFYAGGSSSIRGWRPRRLGPGSYVTYERDNNDNLTDVPDDNAEQPGEILIETSLELRRDLVGFMEGALFLDAGNIWRYENNSDDSEYDKAVFRIDSFLNQVAVAGGGGIRFDLQFLILRLDLGVKLIDPAKERGERFVAPNLFDNFRDNSEINIGIGYPF